MDNAAAVEAAAASFLQEQAARGNAPKTIDNYRKCLRYFAAWCGGRRAPLEELVLGYAAHAAETQGESTAGNYAAHVMVFARWCEARGRGRTPRIRIRRPAGSVKALTCDQLVEAFLAMDPDARFFFAFVFDSALRLSEACALRRCDFREDAATLTFIVRGKGGAFRRVTVGAAVEAAARARLAPLPDDARLFRLRPSGYQTALGRLGVTLGFKCRPHRLRHSFAQHFILAGGGLAALQAILGHTTPHMTIHYARLYGEQTISEQRRFSPVDALAGAAGPIV